MAHKKKPRTVFKLKPHRSARDNRGKILVKYDEYLQDWPSWLSGGYADLVIPQCYRYELSAYQSILDELIPDFLKISPSDKIIYPGILMNLGDDVMSEEFLLKVLDYNRKQGYQGEVFFFYAGLRKHDDRLAKVLLKSFYRKPAKLPCKNIENIHFCFYHFIEAMN